MSEKLMNSGLVFKSPVGLIGLKATRKGTCRILLRPTRDQLVSLSRARGSRELRRLQRQLERYFAGEVVQFDVPLDMSNGTPFQRRVWRACRRIPHGQVRSYGELAKMAGRPGGARAVGGAMGANPLPIVVPCHRVIRSDGSLGGYGLGLTLKRKLLRLEGAV